MWFYIYDIYLQKFTGITMPSGELIWTETGKRFDIGPNETLRTPDNTNLDKVGRLFCMLS